MPYSDRADRLVGFRQSARRCPWLAVMRRRLYRPSWAGSGLPSRGFPIGRGQDGGAGLTCSRSVSQSFKGGLCESEGVQRRFVLNRLAGCRTGLRAWSGTDRRLDPGLVSDPESCRPVEDQVGFGSIDLPKK